MRVLAHARRLVDRRAEPPDGGVPIPPRRLRFSVAGTDDRAWFLRSGRAGADVLREVLGRVGRPIQSLESMLDFGCGCGRVIRHFADLRNVQLHGTDVSAGAIRWCRENLRFADFQRNGLAPPTVYGAETFDLVYAFSVFTHLPEHLQFDWMRELRRVLRPEGLLVMTTHGASYLHDATQQERDRFNGGELIVRHGRAAGSNRCSTLHPESWVRERLARAFDVVQFDPEGARGNPTQDLYLLRAR